MTGAITRAGGVGRVMVTESTGHCGGSPPLHARTPRPGASTSCPRRSARVHREEELLDVGQRLAEQVPSEQFGSRLLLRWRGAQEHQFDLAHHLGDTPVRLRLRPGDEMDRPRAGLVQGGD